MIGVVTTGLRPDQCQQVHNSLRDTLIPFPHAGPHFVLWIFGFGFVYIVRNVSVFILLCTLYLCCCNQGSTYIGLSFCATLSRGEIKLFQFNSIHYHTTRSSTSCHQHTQLHNCIRVTAASLPDSHSGWGWIVFHYTDLHVALGAKILVLQSECTYYTYIVYRYESV